MNRIRALLSPSSHTVSTSHSEANHPDKQTFAGVEKSGVLMARTPPGRERPSDRVIEADSKKPGMSSSQLWNLIEAGYTPPRLFTFDNGRLESLDDEYSWSDSTITMGAQYSGDVQSSPSRALTSKEK